MTTGPEDHRRRVESAIADFMARPRGRGRRVKRPRPIDAALGLDLGDAERCRRECGEGAHSPRGARADGPDGQARGPR